MVNLGPRLVVSTGAPGTGKTTTLKALASMLPNAFYLDRDRINYGILYVPETTTSELLPFNEYVANDHIFPDNARYEETIFGKMLQIDPKNAFHRRHARDQSHLIQSILAAENLALGKIPIIDCFGIRQIGEGIPNKFMGQEVFREYKKFMIHFVLDEEIYYQRVCNRAKNDPETAIRDREILVSREKFKEAFERRHGKMMSDQLSNCEFLLIDTSLNSPKDCAKRCLEYISS